MYVGVCIVVIVLLVLESKLKPSLAPQGLVFLVFLVLFTCGHSHIGSGHEPAGETLYRLT